MARLQLHLHALTAGLVGLALGLSPACGDETVEVPEALRGEPACMWVMDSRGHFEDGSVRLIIDEPRSYTGAACLCLTEAEYESKSRHDELNDRALEVCNQLATQHDFAWTECQENHDSGRWLDLVFWARGQFTHPSGEGLGCVGE